MTELSAPVLLSPPKVQFVRLSSGEAKLTWGATITELAGVDISSDPMLMGLSTQDTPPATGTIVPDVKTASTISVQNYVAQGGTNPFNLQPTALLHQLTASIMISAATLDPAIGSYWVWARLADQSEIEWFVFHKVIIL